MSETIEPWYAVATPHLDIRDFRLATTRAPDMQDDMGVRLLVVKGVIPA